MMRALPRLPVALLRGLVVLASLFIAITIAPRARAESGAHAAQVAVIALDSEDAEEHADALTSALRRSIQNAPGWQLTNTTQSLGMLTASLKCPPKPPPDCQQRIAEQLKAERFVWGTVQKGPATQVTAEVHLYQRGKADTVVKETYAENLKDANDDALRKIAQRIVDRLGGTALGVVVVRAGDANGEVVVDGEKRIAIHNGVARIELAAGSHSIELVPAHGTAPPKRNVLVTAGRDTILELQPAASSSPSEPGTDKSSFPTRKVVGWSLVGAGVISGAVAIQQMLFYFSLKDRAKDMESQVPEGEKPCEAAPGQVSYNEHFCNIKKRADLSSGLAIVLGAVGAVAIGVGSVLVLTGDDGKTKASTKPRIVPEIGQTNGLSVVGSF